MARSSNVVEGLPSKAVSQLVRIGGGLAQIRKQRGLSQENLAERMFVSRQTVHRLEAGDPSVSIAVLAAAMFALGLTRRLDRLVEAPVPAGTGRQGQASGRHDDLDF